MALMISFAIIFVYKVMTGYAPGIVRHPMMYRFSPYSACIIRSLIGTLVGLYTVWALRV